MAVPNVKKRILLLCLLPLFFLCRCENRGTNGYYTAEAADFDAFGWKEYITIYVNRGRIVTVEYNAKNSSGFIKSWDPSYMRHMNAVSGTYPNEYTRIYAAALLQTQNPDRIDALSGATDSARSFALLAAAVIEQAKQGRRALVRVSLPRQPGREEAAGTP